MKEWRIQGLDHATSSDFDLRFAKYKRSTSKFPGISVCSWSEFSATPVFLPFYFFNRSLTELFLDFADGSRLGDSSLKARDGFLVWSQQWGEVFTVVSCKEVMNALRDSILVFFALFEVFVRFLCVWNTNSGKRLPDDQEPSDEMVNLFSATTRWLDEYESSDIFQQPRIGSISREFLTWQSMTA